jgi:macrolide transport system ATP-binding/permease protein
MHVAEPETGRFFTEQENKSRARVAVIGMTIVKKLFEDQNPIGEFIKINKVTFQVIGILPERGATGFRDQDDTIVMPTLTAMYRLLGKNYVDYIDIEIANSEDIEVAQETIKNFVIEQYNIPVSQQQDAFEIRNMADIQSTMSSTSNTMSMLLAVIAAVSLLVGGIGIMNIMLVSVTERTKEIGLRKAVGARRRDIMSQFLTEAGVIGINSGVLGIILGVSATLVMTYILNWTTSISMTSVLLSFSFSVAIGIIFGIWPAKKAAMLNPIDALRGE